MLTETLITAYSRRVTRERMQLDMTSGHVTPVPASRPCMLYVHIPFCESLCPFCSFHRVQLQEPRARLYFRALRKELQRYHDLGFDFAGVYVGGGTPTVLPDELASTLALIRELFHVQQISLETNPNHLHEDVLDALKAARVNRLSVGVQSLDDDLLRRMQRYTPYGSAREIIERLQYTQGVFDTLNADMIFNLPQQSAASLDNDIRQLADEIRIDQISWYPLMSSPSTQQAMRESMGIRTAAREKFFYERIRSRLAGVYTPASAWCFSRGDRMIDEYIVEYDDYVGAGSGAFSYLDGTIYSSTFSINRYIRYCSSGKSAITARRSLNRVEQMQYDFLMKLFGLRLEKQHMGAKYGAGFRRRLWKELLLFRLLGAIREDADSYRLTGKGMYYWLVMMREFFTGVNHLRSDMRTRLRAERDQQRSGVSPLSGT